MNEWRNVAQAAYAIPSWSTLLACHTHPGGSCGDGFDDREDFKCRRLSGQPQSLGVLRWFLRPQAVPSTLLQAGDIGLHNSPHCFPENRHALARATRVIDASISQPN